jgi:hypothetical protein
MLKVICGRSCECIEYVPALAAASTGGWMGKSSDCGSMSICDAIVPGTKREREQWQEDKEQDV